MQKVHKGDYGYFQSEKKRRLIITAVLFAVPLLIFFTGWIYFQSRASICTVIAVVGCLPACKSLVGLIMIFRCANMDPKLYETIRNRAKNLTMSYEMYVTFYEKSGYIDAFAICGNVVAGYSSSKKIDAAFMEKEIEKILRKNGYAVTVKIFTGLNSYLERLDSLVEHKDSLESKIEFKPNEQYPDLSRNELIKHTILAISL
ncbi:MAG TPA: hypothetical protein IAA44_11665 [Candidatus Blautia avistercoris]|nr:hypothetical protein [Candidatus Blautia avistercoris]